MTVAVEEMIQAPARPAWNLAWLTPWRCRMILVLLLGFDVLGHVHYLHNCPADLSGDEAQYWDWSRNLDLSYYSKGPLVAYIIRASCSIFGDTMPAVRYPAIFFGVATSIVTYLLTRKLFGSDRLALGAVLLTHIVPMFIAGSILMTIDPPMFLCWALATLFAAHAIFDNKPLGWSLVGLAIGVGFLAKYAALLWFVGLFVYLFIDPRSRRYLRTAHPYVALLIALLFMTPVILWNARHNWVTFSHVAYQTGAKGGSLTRGNFIEMLGSQIGVIGPILAVFLIAAIIYAIRKTDDPNRPKLLFLTTIGLTFFTLTTLISFFTKVQVNWPAPAYFTLFILTAYYISTRLRTRELWRRWRMWFWGTVALAVIATPILHDTSLLFPLITRVNSTLGTHINPAKADVIYKLRGWEELGAHLSTRLKLHPNAIILCDDYMQTAEAAFYTEGRPKTFYAGSYYQDAKRFTQYDMWPDRRLDNPQLRGKTVIFVGKGGEMVPDIVRAFDKLEPLPDVDIIVRGVKVRTFRTWIGTNFKGMTRRSAHSSY
jgi:hypothetical protein